MIKNTNDINEIRNLNTNKISIFSYKEYLESKSDEYGWLYNDTYVLSYYIKTKKIGFIKFKNLTFTSKLINYSDKKSDSESYRKFLNEIIKKSKNLKIDSITQPQANALFENYPTKSRFCSFGTYKLDLFSNSQEELFKIIHSKHRNVIRKAEKEGVIIKEGENQLEIAYELLTKTYKRQNKSYISKDSFYKEYNNLKENSLVLVSYHNNIPQSSALILYNDYSAFYLHGGSIQRPVTGANNLLHWEAIKILKNINVNIYDFMGARINVDKNSKLNGVQSFKKRFCKEMIKGYLWKKDIRVFKSFIYRIIKNIYSLLKNKKFYRDAIDEERKKGNINI